MIEIKKKLIFQMIGVLNLRGLG